MASLASFALLLVQAAGAVELPGRRLTTVHPSIAGYAPGTDVTQHNLIDLDQAAMEEFLGASPVNFAGAQAAYTLGGNSGARADITLASGLSSAAATGSAVTQANNAAATGYIKSNAAQNAQSISVTYTSTCKQGGLSTGDQNTTGCFTTGGGILTVAGVGAVGAPSAVVNAYRNLAGFSTEAQSKMAGQEYFELYKARYNANGNYSHILVMDALAGTGQCSTCDEGARVQFAKKGSAFLGLWMYVIREMEDAINDCRASCPTCNDDPVHAWDEAVAFYTGSREGTTVATAASNSGKLLHALADKRCDNFGTCGTGTSIATVNTQIFEQFTLGKTTLQAQNCDGVVPIKRRIVELMSVPLIQGSLRYAYKVAELNGGSVERAEGAIFAMAILPRIANCSASAANTINTNMAYTASPPMAAGFVTVKEAFESVYTCLGITCADVGGLILSGSNYHPNAGPCGVQAVTTTGGNQVASSGNTVRFLPIIMIFPVFLV